MNKFVAGLVALALVLGIASPYLPEIHIGPQPDIVKPEPKTKTTVSEGNKMFLLLQQDGWNTIADNVIAKRYADDREFQEALESQKQAATKVGYEKLRLRTSEVLGKLSVTKDEDLQAIADYVRKIAAEYGDAASE